MAGYRRSGVGVRESILKLTPLIHSQFSPILTFTFTNNFKGAGCVEHPVYSSKTLLIFDFIFPLDVG
jgi:hypothetical protein